MAKKVIDKRFVAIVDSISYWLGYQFKIGRDQLIHEASLRYPIADTITSSEISVNRIVLEKLHPIFKGKRIDLVIYDKRVNEPALEKDDHNLIEAYEFKLAKSETSKSKSDEHQRVIDDLLRLAYYHKWGKKDCYFLMSGRYEDFKTYFVGQRTVIKKKNKKNIVPSRTISPVTPEIKWDPSGLYKDWFEFEIGKSKDFKFQITKSSKVNSWGLRAFQKNYDIRDKRKYKFSKTIEVRTTCMAITPSGLEKSRTHAAGVWKIESV